VPSDVRLFCGDCLDVLPTLESGSVDAVICDPPYPEIDRPYGRLTEREWFALMDVVVPECRRILKPHGSAVFVLQPNSERVGRMRPWLWEFMAKWTREWNMVQDVWWWNTGTLPLAGACAGGLMRPSVKACVWFGSSDCWRDQSSVLVAESACNRERREIGYAVNPERASRRRSPTEGSRDNTLRMQEAAGRRGGATPFNLLPLAGGGTVNQSCGHVAPTPLRLCDWWTRYIVPPGGVILDPFAGSGTTGISAVKRGHDYIGVEKMPEYHAIAERRIREAQDAVATPLFDAVPEPVAVGYKQQTFAEAEGV
jgi:hypothetical protein